MANAADLTQYIGKQADRFSEAVKAMTEAGEPEAVHAVRVASRRLEEPLAVMDGVLKGRGVKSARKSLKRVRRAFRKVRELDVLVHGLSDREARPPADEAILTELGELFRKRREKELPRAQRRCRQVGCERVIRDVGKLCRSFEKRAGQGQEASAEQTAAIVECRRTALLAATPDCPGDDGLHPLRIAIKRFRYAVEMTLAVEDREDASLVDGLKSMQDLLGHWNDCLAAARAISAVGRKSANVAERTAWSAALLGLAADWLRRAEGLRSQVCERWPGFAAMIEAGRQVAGKHEAGMDSTAAEPAESSVS